MKTVTLEYKLTYHDNGQIKEEAYSLDGQFHNPNGIAFKSWHSNGQISIEEHYLNGKMHNPNGIAYQSWDVNGNIKCANYWIDGKALSKDKFNNRNSPKPCDNKTVEVDGVKYKLTAI